MASVSVDKVVVSTKNVYTLKMSEDEAKTLTDLLSYVKGSKMTSRNSYCDSILKELLDRPDLSGENMLDDIEGYLTFT